MHVNILISVEFAIEVGAIKVEGVNLPVIICSNGKNGVEADKLSNWRGGVKVVDTELLCESTCYKACLILLNGAICYAVVGEFLATEVKCPLNPKEVNSSA